MFTGRARGGRGSGWGLQVLGEGVPVVGTTKDEGQGVQIWIVPVTQETAPTVQRSLFPWSRVQYGSIRQQMGMGRIHAKHS